VRELELKWSSDRITVELEQLEVYSCRGAVRKLEYNRSNQKIRVELEQ
jgi:hypothetical protein